MTLKQSLTYLSKVHDRAKWLYENNRTEDDVLLYKSIGTVFNYITDLITQTMKIKRLESQINNQRIILKASEQRVAELQKEVTALQNQRKEEAA